MELGCVLRCVWLTRGVARSPAARRPRAQTAAPDRAAAPDYVIAANPLAVEAGMAVLRRGGSAVDAAIAVEAMLSLVEPQSSGLGGGAFMTHYDAASRRVTRLRRARNRAGRRVAGHVPRTATASRCRSATAVVSGRATGVPGVVRMLAMAHRAHGRLPWSACSAMPSGRRATASSSARASAG